MIKTHGSESRGQEEAAVRDERVSYLHQDSRSESRGKEEAALRDERVSYLHVRSTVVKFVGALNKPPLELSLSYLGLRTL